MLPIAVVQLMNTWLTHRYRGASPLPQLSIHSTSNMNVDKWDPIHKNAANYSVLFGTNLSRKNLVAK